MNKILAIQQAIDSSKKIREKDGRIVLAGGCFDILHIGHIYFLQNAKQQGEVLFLLLESDEAIQKTKGAKRPINTQKDRAVLLASLEMVDYVVLLPKPLSNDEYDELVLKLKPDIIATTQDDRSIEHKKRQAVKCDARVVEVVKPIENKSTTMLAKIIENEFVL